MITVYVGNTDSSSIDKVYPLNRMPYEVVEDFHDIVHMDEVGDWNIRTYTDTIINFLGEMVDNSVLDRHEVKIIVEGHGEFWFDERGVLTGEWPFGIFNY